METATVSDAAPAMMIAMGIFVLAGIVLGVTNIPEPHMETVEQRNARRAGNVQKEKYGPMSFRHFVLGAIAIFFYVGVEVGIPNTANLYMSGNPNVGPAIAGTLVGFYWFMMLVGRLIGAPIAGKVSSKTMLVTVSLLAIAFVLCILFIPETITISFREKALPLSMVFVVLCGLCTSVMWGAIFNLSTEGLGKYTPMASGIFMTLVCGGGILPFVQNWVADFAGHINSYWVVVAGFAYILLYALFGYKNVNKEIVTE
jgi:FHS family L-fucose permease-like MFS transporter